MLYRANFKSLICMSETPLTYTMHASFSKPVTHWLKRSCMAPRFDNSRLVGSSDVYNLMAVKKSSEFWKRIAERSFTFKHRLELHSQYLVLYTVTLCKLYSVYMSCIWAQGSAECIPHVCVVRMCLSNMATLQANWPSSDECPVGKCDSFMAFLPEIFWCHCCRAHFVNEVGRLCFLLHVCFIQVTVALL